MLNDSGFLSAGKGRDAPKAPLAHVVAAHSKHAREPALVHALLVSGLFPNVATFKRGAKHGDMRGVRTREDGRVQFHPSSVVSKMKGNLCAHTPPMF